jgi:hypothetical protein
MTEEKNGAPDVPYIVHESTIARMERINKRLGIVLLALAAAGCLRIGKGAGR